jgi:hypothetical protein
MRPRARIARIGLALRRSRVARIVFVILASLFLLFALSGIVVDRPLRSYMERKLNARLQGYTTHLDKADFHPFGFGLDLDGLTLVQNAVPDPPVLRIEELAASVQWTRLLRGRLVADFRIERPAIHLDRRHAEAEDRDAVPVQNRGWQDAVRAIYPLKINAMQIHACSITYLDAEHTRPLVLRDVECVAHDIRNRPVQNNPYPSPIALHGTMFETGTIHLDGRADFLAKPHAGVLATLALANVALDYFSPMLERNNLVVRGGLLDTSGEIEFSPRLRRLDFATLALRDLQAEYVHTAAAAAAQHRIAQVARTARRLGADPATDLFVERLLAQNMTVAWTNRATNPAYKLFIADSRLEIENFSNRFHRGPAKMQLDGKLMGRGSLAAVASFRPAPKGSDFDLDLRVERTPLVTLNDLLRAHGRFDVVAGEFSLYTEMGVKNGAIRGYVKPLFRGVDVYDSKQDKGFFSKIYEGLVGGIASLLKNDERDEIATRTNLSGRVDDPQTSTLQVISNLLRNAFIDAILPGFDRQVRNSGD